MSLGWPWGISQVICLIRNCLQSGEIGAPNIVTVTVPVGLEQLRSTVDEYGDAPYLLTVSDDGRPHPLSVRVRWENGDIELRGGTVSCANASIRPDVTLLWPATKRGGFCLIVDGTATVSGECISIRPAWAVLHESQGIA